MAMSVGTTHGDGTVWADTPTIAPVTGPMSASGERSESAREAGFNEAQPMSASGERSESAREAGLNATGPTSAPGEDLIRVEGAARLAGDVYVVGAKNSALKLMAAALLTSGPTVLQNVPRVTRIPLMAGG